MGDANWQVCSSWGRLTAVNTTNGNIAADPFKHEQRPRKIEHRAAGVGWADVTASGLLFVASTDDNRFRAFEAKTGKQLWVTTLERRGNADPITYQGGSGKQYVAVVATDSLVVYAVP